MEGEFEEKVAPEGGMQARRNYGRNKKEERPFLMGRAGGSNIGSGCGFDLKPPRGVLLLLCIGTA